MLEQVDRHAPRTEAGQRRRIKRAV
jgi:hypothetical protein